MRCIIAIDSNIICKSRIYSMWNVYTGEWHHRLQKEPPLNGIFRDSVLRDFLF